jgi:hypothetical protein
VREFVVRLGAGLLAAVNLWWGVWATVWPEHFFSTFPGFGHRWTAAYPPYNAHLVADLGATFITLGCLLTVAAVVRDDRVRAVVFGATLLFNGLHLVFHARRHAGMTAFDATASIATLAAGALAPAVLLALVLVGRQNLVGRRNGAPAG